jgi:hypothetical protein
MAGDVMVQGDPHNHQLTELIVPEHSEVGPGPEITLDDAEATARALVVSKLDWGNRLSVRDRARVDHGVYTELRVVFQERRGDAWLPRRVTVSVNAATGELSAVSIDPHDYSGPVTPVVAAAAARSAAMSTSGISPSDALVQPPALEGQNTRDGDRLMWSVEVRARPSDGIHVPSGALISVDAQSGQAQLIGRAG